MLAPLRTVNSSAFSSFLVDYLPGKRLYSPMVASLSRSVYCSAFPLMKHRPSTRVASPALPSAPLPQILPGQIAFYASSTGGKPALWAVEVLRVYITASGATRLVVRHHRKEFHHPIFSADRRRFLSLDFLS